MILRSRNPFRIVDAKIAACYADLPENRRSGTRPLRRAMSRLSLTATHPMAAESFTIPAQSIAVIAQPDLCVIGGGAAGIAAAVGAARCGLKVLLIEKYGFCGGATVAGMSGSICGLFSSGNRPQRIVFGFAGEFHDRLAQSCGAGAPIRFGRTMLVPHDSFVWKTVADSFLTDEGIEVLYHTNFVAA